MNLKHLGALSMELHTPPTPQTSLSSCKSYFNLNTTTQFSLINHQPNPKPPSQTQLPLPLRRPRRRELLHQPHKPPPPIIKQPPRKTKPTTGATPSDILRLLDGLGLPVPIDIYTSLLTECTDNWDAAGAIHLHSHINRSRIRPGLMLLNRILLMYVSCGLIENARQVFDEIPVRDSNTWAAMISGYMDAKSYEEAINLFLKMQSRHESQCKHDKMLEFPVSWILVCVLKACVQTMNLELGKQIHGLLFKAGYEEDLYLGSSLINLYGKSGYLEGVDLVFHEMACRNTVVWTARLVNNCREERFVQALNVFKEMGKVGVKKNNHTFSSVLKACSRMNDDGWCGQQVHAELIKLGLESDGFVQCGLVDMYAKCGLLKYSKRVFETVGEERTAECWNAMLTGFIQHGDCIEALKVLYAMKSAGLQPQESLVDKVRSASACRFLESNAHITGDV